MMAAHLTHAALATAGMIAAIVITATAGDILTASAMRQVGDLDLIREKSGFPGAVVAVVTNGRFGLGVLCFALSFFSLLYAFSHRDLSLIGPAATSLTFVTNALAAKFFLHENVDRRRWMAAIFVCVGVALVAF
ncbi:MAG: EamA family transporter [Acidobacteriaceae bacterium]